MLCFKEVCPSLLSFRFKPHGFDCFWNHWIRPCGPATILSVDTMIARSSNLDRGIFKPLFLKWISSPCSVTWSWFLFLHLSFLKFIFSMMSANKMLTRYSRQLIWSSVIDHLKILRSTWVRSYMICIDLIVFPIWGSPIVINL